MGIGEAIVVDLADPRATDASVTGAKAANLARCAVAGLEILPGFALTTAGAALGLGGPAVAAQLRSAWRDLAGADGGPLVVRSSSTVEDAGTSSMAGQFTSVLDVVGWDAFLEAIGQVLASAERVLGGASGPQPMAVLVQRQLDALKGGVMFGVDPVTGQRKHVVVEVVPSRPDTLVGGEVTAAHHVLSRRGRLLESVRATPDTTLSRSQRRRLVHMARQAGDAFDRPQDIEWALDRDDHLWMLQSRPVTAIAAIGAKGHVFGPGPVAETFPAPLRRLEVALWLEPLRDGMVRALGVTGAVSPHLVEHSPVLTTVGGWAAVDLQVLGVTQGHRTLRSRISPAAIFRRLGASWRVGRARVALPTLGSIVVASVDDHLAAIPQLTELTDDELCGLLEQGRAELATAHCYEVLAGMLLAEDDTSPPAGVVALQALAHARRRGLDDAQVIATWPVVLSLVPPALGPCPALPDALPAGPGPVPSPDVLGLRDGLRLRTRWLQELSGRVASELGRRLAVSGALSNWQQVRELDLRELAAMVAGGAPPGDLGEREAVPAGPPLPDAFRLSASGQVMSATHHKPKSIEGVPAGAGQASGVVCHRLVPGARKEGVVLVVRHLEPGLAAALPRIDGLVAETGSALSHLAILARELHIPTVVGVPDARHRFPPGCRVFVDGGTGEVSIVEQGAQGELGEDVLMGGAA